MIDYHLHLWPHSRRDTPVSIEVISRYVHEASEKGVVEIALTEHLFRFRQADAVLRGFWKSDSNVQLAREMESYWNRHALADLDQYVEAVQEAKAAGLPVILGLEVDYYPDQMDIVADLLKGYPFDVLLGSVHWLGAWGFDDIDSDLVMAEWEIRDIEGVWDHYTTSLEELAQTKVCDVLAHPDLVKICGRFPRVPEEFYDRMAEAAKSTQMSAELSSAGWRKPIGEQYPARYLLKKFVDAKVGLTTASDAHRQDDVASNMTRLRELLDDVGCHELTGYHDRKAHSIKL